MTLFKKMVAVLAAAIAFTAAAASAQELKIGLKTEPSSLDPQYHALTPNLQVAFYMFDTLVRQNESLKPMPGLALSWKPILRPRLGIQAAAGREIPRRFGLHR